MKFENRMKISKLCDEFEAQLQAGRILEISSFLVRIEEPLQGKLCEELIRLQIDHDYENKSTVDFSTFRGLESRFVSVAKRIAEEISCGASGIEVNLNKKIAPSGVSPRIIVGGIERYKLLEKIGDGGFGTVWIAEQFTPNRKIALKLMRAGASLARFDAERQALSRLNHPNIAKIYDGGRTDDGIEFLTMELVLFGESKNPGMPIDIVKYCDFRGLGIRERISIFLDVCKAISYAHQKAIIHRDLKPANILVTELDGSPIVKVVDFGIAKSTEGKLTEETLHTFATDFVGTIVYSSPEQRRSVPRTEPASADIDVRSDVYSLGIVLYELLVGTPPLDVGELNRATIFELLQIAEKHEALPPSKRFKSYDQERTTEISKKRGFSSNRLTDHFKDDLDKVVMKSIAPERNRRYESVSYFSDDLLNYLNGEVVSARTPTIWYRASKHLSRHRKFWIVTSAILALLLAAITGTTIGMLRSNRFAYEARLEKQRAIDAQLKTEKALVSAEQSAARSSHLLASMHWSAGDVAEAMDALDSIKPSYRNIEWYLSRQEFQGSDLTLFADENMVLKSMFTPDGTKVVSLSENEIKVWDAASGRKIAHYGDGVDGYLLRRLWQMDISSDGKWIATAAKEYLCVFQLELGFESSIEIKTESQFIQSLAFSPSESVLAVGNSIGVIELWDILGKQKIRSFKKNNSRILRVDFSPDGTRLLSSDIDGNLTVWEIRTGEPLFTIQMDEKGVASFSPDGTTIASTCFNDTVRVFDSHSGKPVYSIQLDDTPYDVEFSPDGSMLAISQGLQGKLVFFNVSDRAIIHSLAGHEELITSISFRNDGSRVVTSSLDGTVKIWNVSRGGNYRALNCANGKLNGALFNPKTGDLIYSTDTGKVVACDPITGKELWEFVACAKSIDSISINQSGSMLMSWSRKARSIRVWDYNTQKLIAELEDVPASIADVEIHPTEKKIGLLVDFSPNDVEHVHFWNWESGSLPTIPDLRLGTVFGDIEFSPDGKWIAATGNSTYKHEIFRYKNSQYSDGEIYLGLAGHTDQTLQVAFSPNGKQVCSLGKDGNIIVWNWFTRELVSRLQTNSKYETLDMTFSPDGSRIASCHAKGIQIWDPATSELVKQIFFDSDSMQLAGRKQIAFSPDGTMLVFVTESKVLIWDIR